MSSAVAFADLLARSDVWRGQLAATGLPAVASGFAALDAELPGGGWPRGGLTELLCDAAGGGELSLLLPALASLSGDGGWLLMVAPPYPLCAPAWAAAGVALARLLVVAPAGERAARDALWAAEQSLASEAPAAVICWSATAEARAVRRLQVAAAAGPAACFLIRPGRAVAEASAAPLRLALAAGEEGRLAVRIVKRRGPPLARPLQLTVPRPAPWSRPYGASDVHAHATPVAAVARAVPATALPRRVAAVSRLA